MEKEKFIPEFTEKELYRILDALFFRREDTERILKSEHLVFDIATIELNALDALIEKVRAGID